MKFCFPGGQRVTMSYMADFRTMTLSEWRGENDLFGDDVVQAATALASVQARRTPQSTHPDADKNAIGECRAWVQGVRRNL